MAMCVQTVVHDFFYSWHCYDFDLCAHRLECVTTFLLRAAEALARVSGSIILILSHGVEMLILTASMEILALVMVGYSRKCTPDFTSSRVQSLSYLHKESIDCHRSAEFICGSKLRFMTTKLVLIGTHFYTKGTAIRLLYADHCNEIISLMKHSFLSNHSDSSYPLFMQFGGTFSEIVTAPQKPLMAALREFYDLCGVYHGLGKENSDGGASLLGKGGLRDSIVKIVAKILILGGLLALVGHDELLSLLRAFQLGDLRLSLKSLV